MAYVWGSLAFPEAASLDKRVPKKFFVENSAFSVHDRKLFASKVNTVYWRYTLKPDTCAVASFSDEQRAYLEVAVLQLELTGPKGYRRVAEMVHRAIPYPLLLGLELESDTFALSVAPKRFSQAERDAVVVETLLTAGWLHPDTLSACETAFVESLAWTRCLRQHYGALYQAWVDCFIGYECALLTGTFHVDGAAGRIERLQHYRRVESSIAELRKQLKKVAFHRQVELNTRIKNYQSELKQLAESL